jgi:hypothetical protein
VRVKFQILVHDDAQVLHLADETDC